MTRLPGPVRPLFPLAKRTVLAATAAAGPVARRAGRAFGPRAAPARAARSTGDHARANPASGIEVQPILPPIELRRPLPAGLPDGHWCFAAKHAETVPPAFVATVPGGRVVGPYGAVVAADGTLLFDLSPYFGVFRPERHPIFLRPRLPPVEAVDGTVAVLTTRGVDNYHHFLLDVLPRLELLRAAGATADRYVVNRSRPFQSELLDWVGVPASGVIESSRSPHVRGDRVVAATLPDAHLRAPPWVVAWLRRLLLPAEVAPPSRRLFIARGSKRHGRSVRNEGEVVALLAERGVVPFHPEELPVMEQVRAFAEAEVVVAVHGAALTNLAFCPPGALVVELFAPDYVNVCYWALACQVEGLRYRYVVGTGRPPRPGREMMGVASDIEVDLRALATVLDGAPG